jgi:hypothetical protein
MTELMPHAKNGRSFPAGIDCLPLFLVKIIIFEVEKILIKKEIPISHLCYSSRRQCA